MGRAFHLRASLAAGFLLAVAAAASGCGGSTPAGPTPPIKTPPPALPNTPPVITSLTLSSPRVEAGEDVQVTAVVEDSESPLDQLAYDWSATPASGVFSGSGREVRWTAPAFVQTTPDLYALRLMVTERYIEKGRAGENTVSSSVPVHYNDSRREIARISLRFLTELFPDHSVPAAVAVQDFSDSCVIGKAREFSDVANNRVNFHILSGSYTGISIDLNNDKTFADVRGTCEFRDIPLDPGNPYYGRLEAVSGTCHLTTIYEDWKWFLCESSFEPPYGVTIESLRYRVPGRIVQIAEP
jgi:hypothetical protein